jgi:hypothetical protein
MHDPHKENAYRATDPCGPCDCAYGPRGVPRARATPRMRGMYGEYVDTCAVKNVRGARKNATERPVSVRIYRLSPLGVTRQRTRQTIVSRLPCEDTQRLVLAYLLSHARPRFACCLKDPVRLGPAGSVRPNESVSDARNGTDSGYFKHPYLRAATMSKSFATTSCSSQFGGFVCQAAFPTTTKHFLACTSTKGIIA